jgi:membrane fusion protein, multidrug efflux system
MNPRSAFRAVYTENEIANDNSAHPHASRGARSYGVSRAMRCVTIRARVILPNPDHLLTPGLYARVQLESAGTVQALLIDDKAILTDQNQQYVYVVGPGNVAQRKDVVTGGMADGLRLIRSGLAPGDRVIVSGLQQIYFPGAPVTPKDVDMASLTASSTSALAQEASK